MKEEVISLFSNAIKFKEYAHQILGMRPENNSLRLPQFDIGIITSTVDEFESIITYLKDVMELDFIGDDSIIYYKGILETSRKVFKIIIPYPQSMGMEAAVSCTTKIISYFNPFYMFMVGVCAGNKNVTKIGDIIIAEKSVNYNNVVEIDKEGKDSKKKFMQNADSINKNFKSRLSLFSRSKVIPKIKNEYQDSNKFANDLKCDLGLIVTGSSLVRSDVKIREINDSYHGVKGMDMETHGFYFAVSNFAKTKNTLFASFKSVSDFGDDTKHKISSHERKEYALYTSSRALIEFIMNELK